jgi:hypothetical protein
MAINLVKSGRNLLRSDTRSLDDRPPLFDLGLVEDGERFRRLQFARSNFPSKHAIFNFGGAVGSGRLHSPPLPHLREHILERRL